MMQCKDSNRKQSSASFISESPTLAVNDVNKDVNDDNGACPADACTAGTTEWKIKKCVVTIFEEIKFNAKMKIRQWQWK